MAKTVDTSTQEERLPNRIDIEAYRRAKFIHRLKERVTGRHVPIRSLYLNFLADTEKKRARKYLDQTTGQGQTSHL